MFFRQLRINSVLFPLRWPLPALAALLILLLAAALLWAAAGPAGAQDGYQPDQQVVVDVWSYARETDNGFTHVLRWMQVLHTLGALEDMSAAEARDNAGQYWAARWDPVADELANLEAQDDYEPDQQVVDDVWSYARETDNGFTHVLRWMRVLSTLGAIEAMTSAEARGYANQYLAARWDPVADELAALEAAAAVPAPTATPEPTPEPTPDPNQAPVVNTQAKRYAAFTGDSNAPRGVLVWKRFQGIFSDPDGDDLSYSVAVTQGRTELVQDLDVRPAVLLSNGEKADILFLVADADGWKSLTSSLPSPQVVTVTLTATDPGGLSASVSGDFSIEWGLYPEVVSARAEGAAIELTFDWAVEANPAPKPWQFTVNVVNEDGSTGTIAVNSVSVDGKVLTLELASALDGSQTVTVDYNGYNYLTGTPLQRAGGGDNAPSFSGQAVDIPRPPGEPQNLALSAGAGSLDISATWDALDGADTYRLRWRQSGGEFEAANAATVSETEATITVSDYGEWEVRLQACNDVGCGPEAEQTVTLLATPGTVENMEAIAVPGRLDILASWQAVEGATSYKLRWRQPGGEFDAENAATVSGDLRVITVPEKGQWEVRLQACNDAGCGPEASRRVDVVQELQSSLAAQDAGGNARSRTITANWDPVPDAASYTLLWQRIDSDAPTQPGADRQSRAATNSPGLSKSALSDGQASGGDGRVAHSSGGNRLDLPAGQTSAEFTVPDGGAYQVELQAHAAGNALIARSHHHVNQAPGQPDTTPPRMVRGQIDGDRMTIYFSEPLDENAAGGSFYMALQKRIGNHIGWSGGAVDAPLEISGNKVTVDFEGRTRAHEGLWAFTEYLVRPGEGAKLRDLAGNRVRTPDVWYDGTRSTPTLYLDNLTGPPYVPPVPAAGTFGPPGVAISSDAGADRTYVGGDTVQVTLTFSEAVDVTGTPRVKIDLDPAASGERWADYASGSGTKTLEFAYTVVEGDLSAHGVAVLPNTLELNGGTVRSASAITVEDSRLAHAGLDHDPNHKVVTPASAPPALLSASVTGATLTLTFSEALGAAASLANSAFTVKKTPQGGSEQTVTLSGSPAISGGTVALTLASAVLDTDAGVRVSYEKPPSGANNRLIDLAGNEAASFLDKPVVNSADTTPPRLVRGEIDGDTMTLYFSEALDEGSAGDGDYFRVNWLKKNNYVYDRCRINHSWIEFTAIPREVIVSGNTVMVVGMGSERWRVRVGKPAYAYYFFYPKTATGQRLRDLSGNPVHTPLAYRGRSSQRIQLDNVTRMPYPKYATVDGNQLTLTFNAPIDGDSRPSASAFTVKVDGSRVSLAGSNPVAVSGNTVTLTLASSVAQGASVTVSYVKPSSSPIRNAICENAPSFSEMPVTVGPDVTGVEITSDAGGDNTYGLGDEIRVRLTFMEAVNVTGAPRLKIKMDPRWGEFWANYDRGSGTDTLTFVYTVSEPNTSPQGIAVLANTLEFNGGKIRLMSDRTVNARLGHAGLAHDASHKVDWRQ